MGGRLEALRVLLDNPASNPTAAAFGIAMIALGLLLLIVLLLTWALWTSRSPGPTRRRRSTAPLPKRRATRSGVTLATGVALAALALGYASTSQNSYCTSLCHATAAASESWRASEHREIACVRCHEGVPVVSATQALLSRAYSVYAETRQRQNGHASAVPSSRCMDCHWAIRKGISISSAGLAMRHSDVIAAGLSCEDCHGRQGHDRAVRTPPMFTCLRCHDGRTARTGCDTCHRKAADTLIRPQDTRFGKVALPERPTCEGCHSLASCDACHRLRMPHPVGYGQGSMHASAAAFDRKETLCYRCHTFDTCSACHMPFNAHVADFKEQHKQSPWDGIYCLSCHKTKDMCGLCH